MLKSNAPLKLLHQGKVRDIYEYSDDALLFFCTDRLSAFDVIMLNGIENKGKLLTQLSFWWFHKLKHILPNHLLPPFDQETFPTKPDLEVFKTNPELQNRSLLVKKLKILPIEAIVRGYLTGSGWKSYLETGEICGIYLPKGLQESQKLSQPIFTPTTKAEIGNHDENISFEQLIEKVGQEIAEKIKRKSLEIYQFASEIAKQKGILIADTKMEFGLDEKGELYVVDEVLTPDSSRFWLEEEYQVGTTPKSLDKQFVRDYLTQIQFDKKKGIEIPQGVLDQTMERYKEAFIKLTGQLPVL